MRSWILTQFKRPSGALGAVAGWIMAARDSNRARNRWTVDLLDIQPTDRILEIGFGPGLGLALAAAKATAGTVVGIDHSEVMFRQAGTRNRDAIASGRLKLRLGGFDDLPAGDGPFDKVFSANVLMFVADRKAALAALRGAMRPGGLVATTYQPRHVGATAADAEVFAQNLGREMAELGFTDIRRETLALKPLPAVCVLGRA